MKARPEQNIVTFGIPVPSRAVAIDWHRCQHFLRATVGSIYRQTDPNFRVLICCTEKPDLTGLADERTEYLQQPQADEVNVGYRGLNVDKHRRLSRISQRAAELSDGYLMPVDADDLVSNRLVEFVRSTSHPHGYVARTGFLLDCQTGYLAPLPNPDCDIAFDAYCGTCALFNYSSATAEFGNDAWTDLIDGSHVTFREKAAEIGRPLVEIPFPAVVYVRNTGENTSFRGTDSDPARALEFNRHVIARIPAHRISRRTELDREFDTSAAVHPRAYLPETADITPGPSLSILVTTYRRAEGLKRLLASLQPQIAGHSDRELIVVNDGSHDAEYQAVVESFGPLLRYAVLENNSGVGAARQHAASLARNDFIVYIDDDCVAPNWWLDWLTARLCDQPEIDVFAGTTVPLTGTRRRFIDRVEEHFGFNPHPWFDVRVWVFVTANVAIRRELFEALGGFLVQEKRLRAAEDTDLSCRLHQAGANIVFDDAWFVRHQAAGSLESLIKRYWGYGFANVWTSERLTAPVSFRQLAGLRRRDIFGYVRKVLGRLSPRIDSFSNSRRDRLLALVFATAVEMGMFFGGIAASKELRRLEPNRRLTY